MSTWSRAILVVVLLAMGAALANCRPNTPADAAESNRDRPLRIVTTIRPLELIVRELLDDPSLDGLIEVTTIMSPEVSPHGFEPTPAQVAQVTRADLVVYNGLGLDNWAGRGLPAETRIARFEDVADLEAEHELLHEHDHAHDHGEECDHGPIDEHFWVDPTLVAAFAKLITGEIEAALQGASGNVSQAVEDSLDRFLAAVNEVNADLKERFAPHQGRRIVTHHNVFRRLTNRYGLGEPIVLRPLAILEPTPGDLRGAIEAIRSQNVRAILIEPQFSPAAAQRVAEETHVEFVEVDPLGTRAGTWSELMRQIGEAVEQSLRQ